jgi:hypothetical protein
VPDEEVPVVLYSRVLSKFSLEVAGSSGRVRFPCDREEAAS